MNYKLIILVSMFFSVCNVFYANAQTTTQTFINNTDQDLAVKMSLEIPNKQTQNASKLIKAHSTTSLNAPVIWTIANVSLYKPGNYKKRGGYLFFEDSYRTWDILWQPVGALTITINNKGTSDLELSWSWK